MMELRRPLGFIPAQLFSEEDTKGTKERGVDFEISETFLGGLIQSDNGRLSAEEPEAPVILDREFEIAHRHAVAPADP